MTSQNYRTKEEEDFRRCELAAIIAWGLVLLITSIRALVLDIHNSGVYEAYLGAGRHWRAGDELYGSLGTQFRYSPLVAAFFVPFTILPDHIGSVVWRIFNAGIYIGALLWWVNSILPRTWNRKHCALFFLLVLPLSIGNLNNAQTNPLMTGLMLLALASVNQERWNTAAICLAASCFLKVYPICLAMLLILIYPRQLPWRLVLALLAGVAICFLTQAPDYVARQFSHWFYYLRGDLRSDWSLESGYRDFRLLLRVIGIWPNDAVYMAIQLIGAAAAASVCFAARGIPRQALMKLTYALAACWILLFGPATESSTYILIAPALAWQVIDTWTRPHPVAFRRWILLTCALLGIAGMAAWFPGTTKVQALGLQPLAVVIFLGCILHQAKGAISGGPTDFNEGSIHPHENAQCAMDPVLRFPKRL